MVLIINYTGFKILKHGQKNAFEQPQNPRNTVGLGEAGRYFFCFDSAIIILHNLLRFLFTQQYKWQFGIRPIKVPFSFEIAKTSAQLSLYPPTRTMLLVQLFNIGFKLLTLENEDSYTFIP